MLFEENNTRAILPYQHEMEELLKNTDGVFHKWLNHDTGIEMQWGCFGRGRRAIHDGGLFGTDNGLMDENRSGVWPEGTELMFIESQAVSAVAEK
eukprot:CCRYP_014811-RA/>CCRYP_014811-RA protein AED:0.30 eAED:0.55 QI:0/0/0/1/0/0/2/0/94